MPRQKHIKHNAIAFIRITVCIRYDNKIMHIYTENYDRVEEVNARINILIEKYHNHGIVHHLYMKNRHHFIHYPIKHYISPLEDSYIEIEPIYMRECRDDPALREELNRRTNPYYPRDRFPLPLSGPQFPNDPTLSTWS